MGVMGFNPKTYSVDLKRKLKSKRWKLLRLMTRIEDLARYMPNVKSCRIVAREADSVVTEWAIDIEGIPVKWRQREKFDFKGFQVSFEAIEGDLQDFSGHWKLSKESADVTEVHLHLQVKVGIPQVEEIIGDMIVQKIKKNFSQMLDVFEESLVFERYKNLTDRQASDVRGFAVICHPYNYMHLVKYLQSFNPDLKLPSREFLSKIFEMTPSYASYEVKSFRSANGKTTRGYFIMCPILPDMIENNLEMVMKKVVEACRVAEKLGLGILTLGGFTSIAAEKHHRGLPGMVNIPVTTGNTFTAVLAVEGVKKAAQIMCHDLTKCHVAVIGGAGDIGSACARALSRVVKKITITGRNPKNLIEVKRALENYGRAKIEITHDNRKAVQDAEIVIAAASSTKSIVEISDFKPGAVVCDIGYPKNISHADCDRNDLLIFSGGICAIPDEFDFGFDVGLPSKRTMYGCFSEAILLDLEERYENYSWGKGHITEEKMNYLWEIAGKHGFGLAPFFWGNQMLSDQELKALHERRKRATFDLDHA